MKKIAVSACLLGHAVRYDGGNKYTSLIVESLKNHFEIVPICPESEAGLGVPRPPMHIIKSEQLYRAVLVESPNTDLTATLNNQSKLWLDTHKEINGVIVKSRSPSCAFGSAPIINSDIEEKTHGLFVASLLNVFPAMPIIDEEAFMKDELRNKFIDQVLF